MNKIFFLQWLLITTIIAVLIGVAQYFSGAFTLMASYDISYICYGIWGLFAISVLYIGSFSFRKQTFFSKARTLAEMMTSLGLLGSVIGLSYSMMQINWSGLADADKQEIVNSMGSLSAGIGTSLTTTITGIIASLLITVYILFLRKKDA